MNEFLQLIEKEIEVSFSPVLFNMKISGEDFDEHFCTYNSQWTVQDGWISGKNAYETAGMAVMKKDFPGNILLEFECRTVFPSTHDINFMWNGEWNNQLNSCGNAYVGSICGWYLGRTGIEKSPDYKLRVTTPNNCFEPYKTYKVHAGNVNGTCFIFINNELALEVDDPDPIDSSKYSKIAFTAWSSQVQFRNIIIRQIKWNTVSRRYEPEFK